MNVEPKLDDLKLDDTVGILVLTNIPNSVFAWVDIDVYTTRGPAQSGK